MSYQTKKPGEIKKPKETRKPEETASTSDAYVIAKTQLLDGIAQLFVSGHHYDLIVRCERYQWRVHRLVLTLRSTFFANACKDTFKEGISHVIDLKEDDPALVLETLRACYTNIYDDSVSGDNKLDFNARMYAMADKYDIPFLKNLSKNMFKAQLDAPLNIPHFLDAFQIIYTSTLNSDRGLRDLLSPFLIRHRIPLSKDEVFLDLVRSGFADGDFAVDVIAALSQLRTVYFCSRCEEDLGDGFERIRCEGFGCGNLMRVIHQA